MTARFVQVNDRLETPAGSGVIVALDLYKDGTIEQIDVKLYNLPGTVVSMRADSHSFHRVQ